MKRLVMLMALLLSVAILTACAGPAPRPVVIQEKTTTNK
jgi:hypothetical protein